MTQNQNNSIILNQNCLKWEESTQAAARGPSFLEQETLQVQMKVPKTRDTLLSWCCQCHQLTWGQDRTD